MEKQVRPVFTLELGHKILPGLVTIGKYDGTHPCLTAATNTDKVLIHSPHRKNTSSVGKIIQSESNKEIAILNINQAITALVTGLLIPNEDKDILIIGTPTNLLVYHVHDNKDIFYKECEDGVRSVTIGTFKNFKTPVVLVGGNSSIHGYDHKGNDVFWVAIGDMITSMILMDYDKDDTNELIVSSEDYNIRILKGDKIVTEHNETEVVSGLIALPDQKFAYSVSNGTVGVYEKDIRLWRVKSKNFAVAMHEYDLLGQSSTQLITGWSNGKVDCRIMKSGEVLFKDSMCAGVAGIVEGDYRSMGKTDLICVSTEGEVRGYTTTKTMTGGNSSVEQNTIENLLSQKQALLMELKHYENNVKYNSNASNETESYEASGVIPSNTRLQVVVSTSNGEKGQKPRIELYICTNNSTIIKAVIIFAEGIFKDESHVIHPETSKLSSDMLIPLYLPRDNPVDIHLKALIGYPSSIQFHVFEVTKQLPCFSMYAIKDALDAANKPKGHVQFRINERLQRICMWINQNFIFPTEIEVESEPNLVVNIQCLRDNTDLIMEFEISGKVTLFTDNMFLAADLIQSLSGYLKLENLESKASFVQEESNLKHLMQKLSDIQEARLKLDTDVADRLGQIRNLIIRAEDSRINDVKEMMDHYHELNKVNKELINGYNIKTQNYNEGIETMKKINNIIQKASRLRVGQNSAVMINHCRNAIKNNNIEGLIRIIRTGEL
ncbi:unnamed protein product [Ceutorhynchus assimilis]|uniref:Bardet-Biedl syndrome 2 protein homolog n=1 Tax=Ceutorhynchus assimilis TaxID=467358 RepID=A0A9N9MJK5_9CUCU|nr:unnamed protein product [Ceutorhynchus assimilis]